MIKRATWIGFTIGFTLSLFGFVSLAAVRADERDKKDVRTFSRPVSPVSPVSPMSPVSVDVAGAGAEKVSPIVAITPDDGQAPVIAAVQTTPVSTVENVSSVATVPNNSSWRAGATGIRQTAQSAQNARPLPQTASALPLVLLTGLASIGLAIGLMVFRRHARSFAEDAR